ncbi:MAG: GDP-mannose 4,6-dehydratase [Candidatus Eremiobacteraeota bacterium]|nr:GDP-mannose 4,6-dehydratase [Candidatus Eremiobacteraeota bacterium]
MMRALVTGASGFVGKHLVEALRRAGAEVFCCGGPRDGGDYFPVDMRDVTTLERALAAGRPAVVFHLAAQTFVPQALESPLESYDVNAMGTARLAEAVHRWGGAPRIVFTSTAEVYGPRDPSEYPLREHLAPRPINPYGAGKAAAEAMLRAAERSFGLDVVIARSFNHIGPGQGEHFAVASFAAQLAGIARGASPQLLVGDLAAARDFLDVRDVVDAYVALARDGERGEAYNVCSGRAVAMRDILRELIGLARVPVEVREDPRRMRASETPLSVGDPSKLRDRTGWTPKVALTQSLRDVYESALQ